MPLHGRLRSTRAAGLAVGLAVLVAAGAPPRGGHAVQPEEILDDPLLEERARDLSKGLRCLVCQNQSIDDSAADLAKDLRVLVRERLVAGDSDDAVIDYVVARYGDYVLLSPPVKPSTYPLWFLPLALLLGGGVLAMLYARNRRDAVTETAQPLSDEARARARALLDEGGDRG